MWVSLNMIIKFIKSELLFCLPLVLVDLSESGRIILQSFLRTGFTLVPERCFISGRIAFITKDRLMLSCLMLISIVAYPVLGRQLDIQSG